METQRLSRSHFRVEKPVDRVFGLLDPIAEREWVPGWAPAAVHPEELSLEVGSVFHLERDGRREIWTVLRHDTRARVADYLATAPDFQQRWISVQCTPDGDGTEVEISYRVTALSALGAAALDDFGEEHLAHLETLLRAALGLDS